MLSKIKFKHILNLVLLGAVLFIVGRYFYMKPKYINGETVPNIQAQLIDGKDFDLQNLKGRYVLVDFWGSWCGPCIADNKGLVELYAKYGNAKFKNADGFDIVSVGIEQNDKRWKKAIERQNLTWPHHILDKATSLRFFDSPIAASYGIKEVPSKYLLNEKGFIMGVNLPVSEMDRMLADRLQ